MEISWLCGYLDQEITISFLHIFWKFAAFGSCRTLDYFTVILHMNLFKSSQASIFRVLNINNQRINLIQTILLQDPVNVEILIFTTGKSTDIITNIMSMKSDCPPLRIQTIYCTNQDYWYWSHGSKMLRDIKFIDCLLSNYYNTNIVSDQTHMDK